MSDSTPERAPEPPLRLVRRMLRGRWPFAISLAIVLCALGGVGGYLGVPPKYESTGLIQIQGMLAPILFESQENRVPPNFDSYVAAQISYLQSRDILETAISRPELRKVGWPQGDAGVAALRSGLTIRRPRNEPVIIVAMLHRDAEKAAAAVNAVLATFRETCADPTGLPAAIKEQKLVEREGELQAELLRIQQEMLDASDQMGIEAIRRIHSAKVEELATLEERLASIRFSRLHRSDATAVDPLIDLPSDHGAAQLADLEARENRLLAELDSMSGRFGPRHGVIRDLERQLDAVRREREYRAAREASIDIAAAPFSAENQPGNDEAATPSASEQRTLALISGVRKEAANLGEQLIRLEGLVSQTAQIRDRLDATTRRIDELRMETDRDDLNRFSIASWGEKPLAPISDRRQGLAAAGSLLGALTGLALVFLIGLCDPRIRYAEALEALDVDAPIIGLLPEVKPGNQSREPQSDRAVHQLRNFIELQGADPNANVHAITSGERGEGRTSIVLALGSSFAAAGRKTLIIDADINCSTMTRELGLVGVPGLCEAIGPVQGAAQVHPTGEANRFALPVGGSRGMKPEDLSRNSLLWLLEALRSRFDVILIDAGPLLTSVEACLVTAVSDRTILAVTRNQHRQQILTSMKTLRSIGAHCSGLVFNRADISDVQTHGAGKSRTIARLTPLVTARAAADDHDLHRPLAQLGVDQFVARPAHESAPPAPATISASAFHRAPARRAA